MEITYDPKKDVSNRRKHGISLASAEKFDFDAALFRVDDREDYGEVRYHAISFLDALLYVLTFTQNGETTRACSLRKATKYEQEKYREER